MEVLKRLENKIQALVAHRSQLIGELGRVGELLKERENEIQRLRLDFESAQSKAAALAKERDEVRTQIESILDQLVGQLEAQK
jgi:chromosome segregation ATPase